MSVAPRSRLGEYPLVGGVPAGVQRGQPDGAVVGVIDRAFLAPGEVEAHPDDDLRAAACGTRPPGRAAARSRTPPARPGGRGTRPRSRPRPRRCAALPPPAAGRPGPGPFRRYRPRPGWRAGRTPSCPAGSTGPRRRRRRTRGRPGEPPRPRPCPSPPASASSPATLFPSVVPQHSHTTASRCARCAAPCAPGGR